jgi:hypothetical protein
MDQCDADGVYWLHDLDWGNVPSWLTALTALIAATIALATYGINSRTRRDAVKQARESQAVLVSAWSRQGETVTFRNASSATIYNAVATGVDIHHNTMDARQEVQQGEMGGRASVSVLGPGETVDISIVQWGGGAMGRREDFELAFTDNAGRHWVKPARAQLRELDQQPQEHYGFRRPYPW